MNFWSFGAIFVDFSEARDLFVNIFQILDLTKKSRTVGSFQKNRGVLCKICKTGPRVDFGKTEGLLCKMSGNFGRDLFFNG
jgi:hypothetical protein